MRVYVCKAFVSEDEPDTFSIAHVFQDEQKAKAWVAEGPAHWREYEEVDVE